MELFSAQALAAFALAVLPGAVVLEIVEFRRPRLRERGATRSLGRYLLLAGAAWAVALSFGDARDLLVRVLDAQQSPGPDLVDGYVHLARTVALSALGLGLALRFVFGVFARFGFRLSEAARANPRSTANRVARLAGLGLSPFYEWDRLLARLRRSKQAQIAHVRLRDGSGVYGVFAGSGGADFEADGRGLLLDAELIEIEGELVEAKDSTGLFIAPEAVASVSFVALPNLSGQGVESETDA